VDGNSEISNEVYRARPTGKNNIKHFSGKGLNVRLIRKNAGISKKYELKNKDFKTKDKPWVE